MKKCVKQTFLLAGKSILQIKANITFLIRNEFDKIISNALLFEREKKIKK